MATTEVRGCCPHDCPDTCAWIATVDDGIVTGVRGRKDHPFTAGHLCIKVNHYEERVYHPDRILTPLVRTGAKGSGSFRAATWDEALVLVRDGLRAAIDRRGPESVLPCSYMGTQGVLQADSMDRRFFHRLGAAELDRNICLAPGGWAWAFSHPGYRATDPELIGEAEVAIAWGCNPFSTHLHFWPFFQQVRKRGGVLVTVDPFRTKTAAASDLHVQLRPGTDAALALGLLHVIFAEGLEDAEFLAAHTVGADALRDRAAEWPVARASRATGVPAGTIEELARLWGNARPGFVKLGPGANHQPDAGQAFRAVLALPAVTGAWRYPGGGAHVHTADAFPQRSEAMARPDLRPGPVARTVPMTKVGDALQADVAALVVYNCNPAVVLPDTNAVLRGLAREDLFTVVSDLMPTDTVAYADVVLPATTQLEHLDVLWSWGHYYLTLNRPAIAPRGQARPNTEMFRMLAAAMGFDDAPLADDDETLLATYLDGLPADVRAELDANGYVKVGAERSADAVVMLRSDDLAAIAGVDAVPDGRDPPADDGRLQLVTPKAHHFLNSQLVNHPRLRKAAGGAVALLAPSDAAAAAVGDGDRVRLANDHGELDVTARVSDAVLAGTVVVLDNWWHDDFAGRVGVNVLTGQTPTDLGAAPVYTARVSVSRAG
jgi:anaerobic selenocysteine-containing dehydrogenase